jgi:hypothetical protein
MRQAEGRKLSYTGGVVLLKVTETTEERAVYRVKARAHVEVSSSVCSGYNKRPGKNSFTGLQSRR